MYSFFGYFPENVTPFLLLLIPNNIVYYSYIYPSNQSYVMVLSTRIGVIVHPKCASLAFYKNIILKLNIALLNTEAITSANVPGMDVFQTEEAFHAFTSKQN